MEENDLHKLVSKDIRIYVVDDVKSARTVVRRLLNQIGFYNVDDFESATIALDHLHKEQVGLIISDWGMPAMNGLEFLSELKKKEEFNTIPFIMVTSSSEKEQVVEALKAGVSDYIVKPVSFQTLIDKIGKVFTALKKD